MVDTAVSFHIIACRDFFSSYTSDSFGWVRMRNEAKCEIVDMGDVELETSIGCKLVLKYVRHVPEMRFSLISIRKLDDEGYHSHLGEVKWKLTKGSLVLAREKKNNTLYKIEAKLIKAEANIVENETSTELWHKRLGHISEKRLQVFAKKKTLQIKVTSLYQLKLRHYYLAHIVCLESKVELHFVDFLQIENQIFLI